MKENRNSRNVCLKIVLGGLSAAKKTMQGMAFLQGSRFRGIQKPLK